ncbi:hypothetical protein BJV74DRAFT_884542 [Russula compacta]|nr:hypothetical protein BJV74DRAFT_884542 [Russula compacta]
MSLGSFGYALDSDEEHTVSNRSMVSRAEFDKMQKALQLENGELKITIQNLHKENATLKAAASKGRGRRIRGEVVSESDEQTTLAKKYCLTIGLWVDRFKDGVDSQQSTALNHARTLMPLVLKDYNLPLEYFQAGVDRSTIPEIKTLLGFNDHKKKYSIFPPILYKDCEDDPAGLFLNTSLPMLYRGLIFGTSSINGKTASKAMNGTIGRLWGLTRITEGGIAGTAIMICFTLSPDVDFSCIGAKSGIEYEKNFNRYKWLLVTKRDTPQVQAIFKFFNKIVFAGVTITKDSGDNVEESSEDDDFDSIANAFDRLGVEDFQNNREGLDSDDNADNNIRSEAAAAGPSVEREVPTTVTVTTTTAVTLDENTTAPRAPTTTMLTAASSSAGGLDVMAEVVMAEVAGRRSRAKKVAA